MDEKRRQPAFIVAILALLGAASLPQVMKTQGDSTHTNPQEKTVTVSGTSPLQEEEEDNRDRRDLRPFLDYLSDGHAEASTGDDLKDYIRTRLGEIRGVDRSSVHCLVITLPDPVASVASVRFDEFLDVVQRLHRTARLHPGPLAPALVNGRPRWIRASEQHAWCPGRRPQPGSQDRDQHTAKTAARPSWSNRLQARLPAERTAAEYPLQYCSPSSSRRAPP